MNTKTLIATLRQHYQPFHPITNNNISAWAHYVENALDPEEAVKDGKRVFYFEIYTDSQIRYISENIESEQFIPASYSFTAILSEREDEQQIHNIRQSFTPNNYTRVTLRNDSPVWEDDENHISGSLQFFYAPATKYRSNDSFTAFPTFCDATMCWINTVNARLSGSELNKQLNTIVNGIRNNCSPSLPENQNSLASDKSSDSEDDDMQVNIYKVGGANTTLVTYPNGKSLLIDCGIDTFDPRQYQDTIRALINYVQPTAILISHWHLEHYALFDFINKDCLEWLIVPNISSVPKTIETSIYNFGKKLGKRFIFDLSDGTFSKDFLCKYGYANTFLFVGMGQTSQSSSNSGYPTYPDKTNETAIIVSIGTPKKRIIIPSDVSYINWPDEQELKITDHNYFIAPHHGGEVFLPQLNVHNSVKEEIVYASAHFPHIVNWNPSKHKDYLDNMINAPDYKYTENCTKSHYWCKIPV